MNILITGAAGFIGYHLSYYLIGLGYNVFGFDNLNDYYDVKLKKARLYSLKEKGSYSSNFVFKKGDLQNYSELKEFFEECNPKIVINLAAQAGVRFSIENPSSYIYSNLVGFSNVLELSKIFGINHLIYASSSSVYGHNSKIPSEENDRVDMPVSLYGATKKSNELMAYSYSNLFGLPTTGLRLFTVYGPWGRPDMALFLFTKAIINKEPINVFNNGDMVRDFTYIDDVIESIARIIKNDPPDFNDLYQDFHDSSLSSVPYRIFNLGNSDPKTLMEYIKTIENELGIEAIKNYMPMQSGDVKVTEANSKRLEDFINFKPNTSIKKGIKEFINWYRKFYKV